MGGNAFLQLLPTAAFPRLHPKVYYTLKTRLLPNIQALYSHVAVPAEAPEKHDYGDLDFVVYGPRDIGGVSERRLAGPEDVKLVMGATHCIRGATSNFLVPIPADEWPREEGEERYCQVDVHVCEDVGDWKRVVFFHGYGDLGMILGLMARRNGFLLGTKGLKITNPPNPSFNISDSPDAILHFFGLSMPRWKAGFSTHKEVFEWVATSRFFTTGKGFTRVNKEREGRERRIKDDRKMYWRFLEWAEERERENGQVAGEAFDEKTFHNEAMVHFNKKAEYDAICHSRAVKQTVKSRFNGTKVGEWTDLIGKWKEVKRIMDVVRRRLGGEEGVARFLETEGDEGIKRVVIDVWQGMKVQDLELVS